MPNAADYRWYRAELHLHSVLSPCAEIEMLPPLVIEQAQMLGLDIVAVTDHNASANVVAFKQVALGSGVTVIPGMEVQTREEVHVVCLFDTIKQLLSWQHVVDAALPDVRNRPEFFGEQLRVNAAGDVLGREERLLITSTELDLEDVIAGVHSLGGLAIPAHVDRKAFGLLGMLGMVPVGLEADALEISRFITVEMAREQYAIPDTFILVRSGDAHRLAEMTALTSFYMAVPSVSEMRLALQGADGRRVIVQ